MLDYSRRDENCIAIAEEGLIYILYSEAMNEEQMIDPSNYRISLDGGKNYTDLDLASGDEIEKYSNNIVKIKFSALKNSNFSESDVETNLYVKIASIEDLEGRKLYDSDDSHIVKDFRIEYFEILQAALVKKDMIKLVFNKPVDFCQEDIIFINKDTKEILNNISIDNWELDTDGETVLLSLNTEINTNEDDSSIVKISIIISDEPKTKSILGSKLPPKSEIDIDDMTQDHSKIKAIYINNETDNNTTDSNTTDNNTTDNNTTDNNTTDNNTTDNNTTDNNDTINIRH